MSAGPITLRELGQRFGISRERARQLEERLKKRFELPPFLKHFATNVNQLARQDKIPPVYGRDLEMDQVLEILCHRERANSVLLLGELIPLAYIAPIAAVLGGLLSAVWIIREPAWWVTLVRGAQMRLAGVRDATPDAVKRSRLPYGVAMAGGLAVAAWWPILLS